MTQPLDIDELQATAKAATPGPWKLSKHGKRVLADIVIDHNGAKFQVERQVSYSAPHKKQEQDAAYIAAANPAVVDTLIDRLRKAEAASKWISVEDRLPNKYEEVLVWPNPTDYCNTAQLYGDKWKYVEYSIWGVEHVGCQVTHWQPLPAAPDSTPTDSADSEGAKG